MGRSRDAACKESHRAFDDRGLVGDQATAGGGTLCL